MIKKGKKKYTVGIDLAKDESISVTTVVTKVNENLSIRDTDASLFPINPDKVNRDKIIHYNAFGKSDFSLDKKFPDEQTAAEIMKEGSNKTFKIKSEIDGHFFNPNKMKYDDKYKLDKRNRTTDALFFKYRVVTEQSFNKYVQFLETREESLLLEAERN